MVDEVIGGQRYAGIIVIDKAMLLKLLGFEGGSIHDIRMNPCIWNPDEVELVIEHPDLDRVEDGFLLRRIVPSYEESKVKVRGEEYQRRQRIDPPRKGEVK